MVIFTELADRLGVRTPVMDAIMKTLGLHELSIEQLRSL
jgi:hypothetical protein